MDRMSARLTQHSPAYACLHFIADIIVAVSLLCILYVLHEINTYVGAAALEMSERRCQYI